MNYLLNSLFMLIASASAFAFQIPPVKFQVVKQIEGPVVELDAGEKANITISFRIKEGYHIQADEVSDDNLIPAWLSVNSFEKLIFSEPVYPEHEDFKLQDAEETLWVFSHDFDIDIPLEADKNIKPGVHVVDGTLFYQACDDVRCLFPRNLKFELRVQVN